MRPLAFHADIADHEDEDGYRPVAILRLNGVEVWRGNRYCEYVDDAEEAITDMVRRLMTMVTE